MSHCKTLQGGFTAAAVFLTASASAFAIELSDEFTSDSAYESNDNSSSLEARSTVDPDTARQVRKKARHGTLREQWANDTAAISMGLFLYNSFGCGAGLQVGFYVSSNTLIEADLLVAAAILPDLPVSKSTSVGVRQFITGSLYLKGALRYRDLHFLNPILPYDSDFIDRPAQQDMGLEPAIGNRWQWDRFTLGLEWVSVYYPVVLAKAERVYTTDGHRKLDTSTMADVRYIHLQLGASF